MSELERVRQFDAKFRLFAHFDPRAVQSELQAKVSEGPLAGCLVGLKANIACKNAVWHAGLAHRSELRAETDANVTARLRAAGARVLPGLNMDAAALGGATENPAFGTTLNPRAVGHSAGGSSGGSAAAVASGLLDIAIGTDTLGSIRIPASWCGVYGLKPTFGAVDLSGIVPLAGSLDCAGPLSARLSDLWLTLQAIAGPDPEDHDSAPIPSAWLDVRPDPDLSSCRVGLRRDDGIDCEPEVRAALDLASEHLRASGASVVPVSMPKWRPETLRKAAFLLTESEGARVYADELKTDDILPRSIQSLLRYGRDVATEKLVAALAEMRLARAQLDRTLGEVDMLLTPTTPQRAMRLGNAAPVNQADYTALANVAGVPALAVPVPVADGSLPSSVQFIGPAWSEPRLIKMASVLEKAFANK